MAEIGERPLKMRWVMISFAFLATALNYVDRLSFNYLSADGALRKLIPDDSFGYIATSFFVAYMVSNAFSGFVIDKLGTRLGYSLCMAFWTTAAILHSFARLPFHFGISRLLLGLGEASNWLAAVEPTGEWFPALGRSTASGIFNSVLPLEQSGMAGFGYAAYTANSMAFPADVVPHSATASVWGLASVGPALGGFSSHSPV